jgi:hypothetical protein
LDVVGLERILCDLGGCVVWRELVMGLLTVGRTEDTGYLLKVIMGWCCCSRGKAGSSLVTWSMKQNLQPYLILERGNSKLPCSRDKYRSSEFPSAQLRSLRLIETRSGNTAGERGVIEEVGQASAHARVAARSARYFHSLAHSALPISTIITPSYDLDALAPSPLP